MKHSADKKFKFDEDNRKFSKQVENTVGKGEIAHYEQFLLFPLCFKNASFPKGVIVWEWLRPAPLPIHKVIIIAIYYDGMNEICLYFVNKHLSSRPILALQRRGLWKTLEKGENADKQHFLLFPQCFLLYHREKSSF